MKTRVVSSRTQKSPKPLSTFLTALRTAKIGKKCQPHLKMVQTNSRAWSTRVFFLIRLQQHEADGQTQKKVFHLWKRREAKLNSKKKLKKKCFIYDTGGETYDRGEDFHWDPFMIFSNASGPLQCCTRAKDTMNTTFKSRNHQSFSAR